MAVEGDEFRGYTTALAAFATGLYLALLVAGFGFLSLLLDVEVIDEADAGPITGPIMTGIACAALLLSLGLLGRHLRAAPATVPIGRSLLIGLVCGLAWLLAGAVSYSSAAEASETFVTFALHNGIRPFVVVVIVAAALIALLYSLMVIRRIHGARRPGWPWENDDSIS